MDIPCQYLSVRDLDYLKSVPANLPDVQWVWQEMDRIWEYFSLDNRQPLSDQPIAQFYSHPVWLLNGIFTHLDATSYQHRAAIAKYLNENKIKNIGDYGGGFGEMALALRRVISDSNVTVIEPYHSDYGAARLRDDSMIAVKEELPKCAFDAVIAQDVLEHVEAPVNLAWDISQSVKKGGLIIFANCFFPYIKCHLPSTFHLRHTFPWVMKKMGLQYQGVIKGAYHAQVFIKKRELDLNAALHAEESSKRVGVLLNNRFSTLVSKIKRRLIRR